VCVCVSVCVIMNKLVFYDFINKLVFYLHV